MGGEWHRAHLSEGEPSCERPSRIARCPLRENLRQSTGTEGEGYGNEQPREEGKAGGGARTVQFMNWCVAGGIECGVLLWGGGNVPCRSFWCPGAGSMRVPVTGTDLE